MHLARHAIAEADDSRSERAGLDESGIHPVFAPGRERKAAADRHRVDPGPVLVEQARRVLVDLARRGRHGGGSVARRRPRCGPHPARPAIARSPRSGRRKAGRASPRTVDGSPPPCGARRARRARPPRSRRRPGGSPTAIAEALAGRGRHTPQAPVTTCGPGRSGPAPPHPGVSRTLRKIRCEALTPVRVASNFTSREPVRRGVAARSSWNLEPVRTTTGRSPREHR